MLIKKHVPKKLSEIIGQYKGIVKFSRFVKSQKKKAVIIYGEPGVGKTLAARVFATEQNFELLEIPPSGTRDKKEIISKIAVASQQQSLFGGNKLIMIDELESFGAGNRGGIKALIDVIKKTKYPIVLTSNNPWNSKFRTLRKYCEMIEFDKVDWKDIEQYLAKICQSENIDVEPVVLKKIAARSQGDVRSAVMDLDVLATNKAEVKNTDFFDLFREREENIFYAVKMVLKSFDGNVAFEAFNNVKIDSSEFLMWIDQNMYHEYLDPISLKKGYENVALSDKFNNRVSKTQNWSLAYYPNFVVSVGVQQAKTRVTQNISRYMRPELLMKIFSLAAKRRKARGISQQISGKLHASGNALMRDFYPYFNFILDKNPKMGKELTAYLESE